MQKTYKQNKKAFTMVELLVCLVCLGFLAVGIGTFASAVKAHTAYIQARETEMVLEYQDVLDLKANGIDARDRLKNPDNLYSSYKYDEGATFTVSDKIVLEANQKAEYYSDNSSIVSINSHGECRALAVGITVIKVKILTEQEDGIYHDNNNWQYVPVIVKNSEFASELQNLNYYYYGGKHYSCWVYCE